MPAMSGVSVCRHVPAAVDGAPTGPASNMGVVPTCAASRSSGGAEVTGVDTLGEHRTSGDAVLASQVRGKRRLGSVERRRCGYCPGSQQRSNR